jgi:transcriptional regulator with XRE-family HTH domain
VTKESKRRAVHPCVLFLKEARKSQGLSQIVAGERAGYGVNAITNWERGTCQPYLNAFSDLAESLGYELQLVPKHSKQQGTSNDV